MPDLTGMIRKAISAALVLGGLAATTAVTAQAGEVRIAVASNFTAPMREISSAFEQATGHTAIVSFASTGKIFAQITQAAPYDVFLSADQERPMQLEERGLAVEGSRFTYALGRLALFGGGAPVTGPQALDEEADGKIAIANPDLAPYGRAAIQALRDLFPDRDFSSRLVKGENISQTLQFIETGNAPLGFVALSQIITNEPTQYWLVPQAMHAPIAQDAVQLQHGAENPAAQAFLAYLKSPEAAQVIARFGYAPANSRDGS